MTSSAFLSSFTHLQSLGHFFKGESSFWMVKTRSQLLTNLIYEPQSVWQDFALYTLKLKNKGLLQSNSTYVLVLVANQLDITLRCISFSHSILQRCIVSVIHLNIVLPIRCNSIFLWQPYTAILQWREYRCWYTLIITLKNKAWIIEMCG